MIQKQTRIILNLAEYNFHLIWYFVFTIIIIQIICDCWSQISFSYANRKAVELVLSWYVRHPYIWCLILICPSSVRLVSYPDMSVIRTSGVLSWYVRHPYIWCLILICPSSVHLVSYPDMSVIRTSGVNCSLKSLLWSIFRKLSKYYKTLIWLNRPKVILKLGKVKCVSFVTWRHFSQKLLDTFYSYLGMKLPQEGTNDNALTVLKAFVKSRVMSKFSPN